jgi:hypothetical protein
VLRSSQLGLRAAIEEGQLHARKVIIIQVGAMLFGKKMAWQPSSVHIGLRWCLPAAGDEYERARAALSRRYNGAAAVRLPDKTMRAPIPHEASTTELPTAGRAKATRRPPREGTTAGRSSKARAQHHDFFQVRW